MQILKSVVLSFILGSALVLAEGPTVKLGFILPLNIIQGQSYRDIAIMAKEDFGITRLKFDFIFEDNNYESTRTNLAAQKLINSDHVQVVGSVWGLWANIVEPLAKDKPVLHITSAFDFKKNEKVTSLNAAPYNQEQIKILLGYMHKQGIGRLALAYIYEAELLSWISELKALAPAYNVQIVAEEKILDNERDFRVRLLKIKESKPDALWVDMWEPPLPIFLRQYKELAMNIPLVSRDDAFLSTTVKYFESTVGLMSAFPQRVWVEKFQKRFGYEPITYSWCYYDLVHSVMEAYETLYDKEGKLPTNNEISVYLKAKHFVGPLGETFFDDNGRLINKSVLVRIMDGNVIPLN